MSLRFPVIESKKSLSAEEQDYNFVNKEKKKKPSTPGSLQMIEQLRRKTQQQKKQIQNRNITIQGLQRNFESLSLIVKNQKGLTVHLKQQLQNIKKNQGSNEKRATQFHQKYVSAMNQCKKVRQQYDKLKKGHLNCGQYLVMSQRLKHQVAQGQLKYQKLLNRLQEVDSEKISLKQQLSRLRSVEDERLKQVRCNERVRQQLQRQKEAQGKMQAILLIKDQQIARLNAELADRDRVLGSCQQRVQKLTLKNTQLSKQIQIFQGMLQRANKQNQQALKLAQNKQLFSELKDQQQQKLRWQITKLSRTAEQRNKQVQSLRQQLQTVQCNLEQKQTMVVQVTLDLNGQKQAHMKSTQQFTNKEQEYLQELEKIKLQTKQLSEFVQRLTGEKCLLQQQKQQQSCSHGQMSRRLNQVSAGMMEIQSKYGQYLKQIDQNRSLGKVIITNQGQMEQLASKNSHLSEQLTQLRDQMHCLRQKSQTSSNYIKSLQCQVRTNSQQILVLTKELHKYQLQQEELNKILSQQKSKLQQVQDQKNKARHELQSKLREKQDLLERQRLEHLAMRQKEQQKQQALQQYKHKLQQYQQQQAELKRLMENQKASIQQMKELKQQQTLQMLRERQMMLQKQKNNNKLLWEDNKKMKEYEQTLKVQAQRQIQEAERTRQLQMERLQLQMERLQQEMEGKLSAIRSSTQRNSESNSNQLKKILLEKSNQIKIISETYSQLQAQSRTIRKQLTKSSEEAQFYRNRNKEIQTLLERVEKSHKQKLAQAQKEAKSYKEVVSVYEKKEKKALEQKKDTQENLKRVQEELFKLRKKYQGQKIQQKLQLIKNTITDFQLSLKTLLNTFSCNYCVEVVQECVRLQDCGHIYCKKCKAGYQPNCGQCKTKSKPKPDRNVSQAVSKAQYMKILLATIKDDIHKINL